MDYLTLGEVGHFLAYSFVYNRDLINEFIFNGIRIRIQLNTNLDLIIFDGLMNSLLMEWLFHLMLYRGSMDNMGKYGKQWGLQVHFYTKFETRKRPKAL